MNHRPWRTIARRAILLSVSLWMVAGLCPVPIWARQQARGAPQTDTVRIAVDSLKRCELIGAKLQPTHMVRLPESFAASEGITQAVKSRRQNNLFLIDVARSRVARLRYTQEQVVVADLSRFHGFGVTRAATLLGESPEGEVLVWDAANGVVHALDADLRTSRQEAPPRLPVANRGSVRGVYHNGDYFVRLFHIGPPNAERILHSRIEYGRYDPQQRTMTTIGSTRGPMYGHLHQVLTPLPLSRSPIEVVVGQRAFVLSPVTGEMLVYDDRGLVARYSFGGPQVRLTEELIADERRNLFGNEWAERSALADSIRALPLPQAAPLVDALLVTPGGRPWVRRFSLASASRQEWFRFDGVEGDRVACSVSLPRSLEVLHVEEASFVAIDRSRDGVPFLRTYNWRN